MPELAGSCHDNSYPGRLGDPDSPMKSMVAYGAQVSSLGPIFFEAARAYGITPMDGPIPTQGVFRRSST